MKAYSFPFLCEKSWRNGDDDSEDVFGRRGEPVADEVGQSNLVADIVFSSYTFNFRSEIHFDHLTNVPSRLGRADSIFSRPKSEMPLIEETGSAAVEGQGECRFFRRRRRVDRFHQGAGDGALSLMRTEEEEGVALTTGQTMTAFNDTFS